MTKSLYISCALFVFGVSGLSGQGKVPAPSRPMVDPNIGVSAKVILDFYDSLSKGDIKAVEPYVLRRRSEADAKPMYLYGGALVRPPGILGFSQLPRIVETELVKPGFKTMTGVDMIAFKLLMVRYALPPKVLAVKDANGSKPPSRLDPFEEAYCDLWILGADGKWRVACDFFPGVKVESQSLGLMFTADEKYARDRNNGEKISRERSDNSRIGVLNPEK